MRTVSNLRSGQHRWGPSYKARAFVLIAAGGILWLGSPASAVTRTVSGTVACEKGNKVVGIWVESTYGNSQWASWTPRSGASWIANYSAPITTTAASTGIRLHIGCGGTSSSWASNNRTLYKWVSGNASLSARCREAGGTPATRCVWWGATALVGMPFTGWWDRFGWAHPSGHHTSGNWSTDLYQASGTPVRPRVYLPRNYALTLKVNSTPAVTCGSAGKNVVLDVYAGSTRLGYIKYGHLNSVPSGLVTGTTVSQGTQLGTLSNWPWRTGCWEVSSTSGIHTHFTSYNYSGYSCYWPVRSQSASETQSPEGRLIAQLGSTTATGTQQACGS